MPLLNQTTSSPSPPGCSNIPKSKSKLLEHLHTHTHEKVIACPGCGAVFASNTKFKDHITRQATPLNSNFTCQVCHKIFATNRLLQQHVRLHINTHKCPHCEMTCRSPSGLLQHITHRHTLSRPHKCPLCQKNYKTRQSLVDHLETHQDKAIMCTQPECDHVAKNMHAWRQHMRVFHSGNQYCCHVCDDRFPHGGSLSDHLKKIHGFSLPPGHSRFR